MLERELFLLGSLFLLCFCSFRHDTYLETIIICNSYLKFAKANALRSISITPSGKGLTNKNKRVQLWLTKKSIGKLR